MPRQNKGLQIWYRSDRQCWEVGEFEHGKRKRRATNLRSRSEAQARLAELLVGGKPSRPPLTIGEAMAYYLEHHAPTTARPDHLLHLAEKLAPFWGNVAIEDVTKALCQQYIERRKKEFQQYQQNRQKGKKPEFQKSVREMSNDSLRRELEQLQACLRFSYAEGLIKTVPPVWKPAKAAPRSRWLTQQEAASLLKEARRLPNAREYLPLFILVALYTGSRKEAVLTLRWSQVDLKRELIDFRPGQVSENKGRAVVPIPRRLLRELRRAKPRGSDKGFVIHNQQLPLADIKKGFRAACVRAGLHDVTPHTLRHTAASWMVQKGVPLFEVARYLGHSSTLMVERTYGHMSPEHLKRAKESWG